MKKIFFSLFVLLFTITTFSQRIIDKPDYGLSNIPGGLTKIELTETATIFHFHLKIPAGQEISMLKKPYIQDVKGGEKYVATKSEGIPMETKYTMPESGEVHYQLYFPKIDPAVNKIDFIAADLTIYDIVINEQQTCILPKELKGNWLLTDGSNQWDYGFYKSNAIVDKAIWNYKTVENKINNYTIVLERSGKQKTIYAQIDKNGAVKLGEDKAKLATYSTDKVENPNYKLGNDEVYSEMVLKSDSTTYSGYIKDYTARTGVKTGKIVVDNVFTGRQEPYLIKIAEDGSFSVKFPIANPQFVLVRVGGMRTSVFVEPGKETFHYINRDEFLFMGECARINADLKILENKNPREDYQKLRETISETSREVYKKACLEIKDRQIKALNTIAQQQYISQKALQINKLDIEFLAYEQILSYDMYKEDAERNANPKTNQVDNKLEASYYDFITPSILNNKLGLLSKDYCSFINRLMFARILNLDNGSFSLRLLSETAKSLQERGITLSDAELQMVAARKDFEKPEIRYIEFYNANLSKILKLKQNHKEAFSKLQKKDPDNPFSVGELAVSLKTEGVSLTAEENELVASFKLAQKTKEEIAIHKQFDDTYSESFIAFKEKYKENIPEIEDDKEFKKKIDKLVKLFNIKESFVFDLMILQNISAYLERNLNPYTDYQIKWMQGKIKNPFLSNYIITENNRIKAKIEANKTKTGFTVNTVKKTEGDELFESMIAKFKGKVIYVDFWATWCSPCMQGIKEIASLKEEMKNDNVVFLYITNQTSPEKTWNNSIPNIKGEHYRVTQDEWNYLSDKFKISGIPHYVLVNKNGEVVNPKLGFNRNGKIKEMLEKQLE